MERRLCDHTRMTKLCVLFAAGCVATASGGAGSGPPPSEPGPPPGPAPSATAIEAGCTFTANDLKGDPGATFAVSCPANCEATGGIWGTDIYTRDSAVCRAGIHAGAIAAAGGVVNVRLEPGRPAYRGSARHGIQSGDYANFG